MNWLLVLFLKLLSKLPLKFLYAISTFLFIVVYQLIGYRKKVVFKNLKNSFPEKTEEEINNIAREFYKYLCDLIVETIKIPSLSIEELHKRCVIHDFEKYKNLFIGGTSYIIVLGHQGNYEWANLSFASRFNFNFYGIFHPLKNKQLNQYFIDTRGKFGTQLIAMKETYAYLTKISSETAILGMIADQSPRPNNAYWTTFLNQDTGFFWGVERLSKEYNLPVIFADIKRLKRGYYEIFPELIIENPSIYKEGEITELHVKKLEEKIKENPETWFWSHRRWKHKKPN